MASPIPTRDIDPFFVFDYQGVDGGGPLTSDAPSTRLSNYWDVVKSNRGPQPLPDWVVTDAGAVDTDLGILKTGKEADVYLLERAVPATATHTAGPRGLMAAKRYRTAEHRAFHRSTAYTDGRRMKKSRDTRALERGSRYGRELAAGQWAYAEWETLNRYWCAGLPVPYPVQLDGTEILMEFIGDTDGVAAPRLVEVRPDNDVLRRYYDQFARAVTMMAASGAAHGDLSAYNVLADGDDIVIIDLPQVIDLAGNPRGSEFLMRGCRNMCSWFTSCGLAVDPRVVFDQAWSALSA